MKPQYGELAFILVIGALQPVTEMMWGSNVATYYNGVAAFIVIAYVCYRLIHLGRKLLTDWGLRFDNFRQCLPPYMMFAAVAAVLLYAYGHAMGNVLPVTFWYVLALYPLWGIAQQFVLQNLVAKNLVEVLPSLPVRAFIVAALFASAHIPSLELFLMAFVAGFIFTVLYHHYQNLFCLGIAHGILGALGFHLVLGQNQWEILVRYFS
jgi:membrane protease YdiL (CAAX protease family)